jgi:hypothetical protein
MLSVGSAPCAATSSRSLASGAVWPKTSYPGTFIANAALTLSQPMGALGAKGPIMSTVLSSFPPPGAAGVNQQIAHGLSLSKT